MRNTTALVIVTIAFSWAADAQALTIDTFDDGNQTVVQTGSGTTYGFADTAAALGGERDIASSKSGIGLETTTTDVNVANPGALTVTLGGSFGSSTIFWDGNDDASAIDFAGLAGADLTSGGETGIEVFITSSNLAFDLIVTGFPIAGVGSLQTVTVPGPQANSAVFLPFSSFPDPLAFNNLGALRLSLSGPAGLDVRVDYVRSSAIPEPSTIVLAACGFVGVAACGWRRTRDLHARGVHRPKQRITNHKAS